MADIQLRDVAPPHIPIQTRWQVADLAARDALVLTQADIGGVCFVKTPPGFYDLRAVAPAAWDRRATAGDLAGLNADVTALETAVSALDTELGAVGAQVDANTASIGALAVTTAANIAALSAMNSAPGTLIFVETVRDYFLARVSTLALVPPVVAAHPNAAMRWERLGLANQSWNKQTDWGIDPAGGDDENVGTAASPLKTGYELQRRIGMWGLLPPLTVIQLLSNFPLNSSFRLSATMPEEITGGVPTFQHLVTIKGARTQLATGALTASGPAGAHYSPLSRVAPVSRNVIYASGTDFTSRVDKYIRLTSGTGLGYGAWIQVGANGSAHITPWCLEHTADNGSVAGVPVLQPAGIAAGDTFEILDMVDMGGSPLIRLHGGGTTSAANGRAAATSVQVRWVKISEHTDNAYAFCFANIEVGWGVSLHLLQTDLQSSIVATQARHHGCLVGGGIFTTGYIGSGVRFYAGGGRARAQSPQFAVGGGASLYFDGDFAFTMPLSVGVAGSTADNAPASVRLGCVGFFGAGDGLVVGQNGALQIRVAEFGSDAVYGTVSGYAARVHAGGKLFYTTKPTINAGLGAGREARVGGTNKLWSEIPYLEPANGAVLAFAGTGAAA